MTRDEAFKTAQACANKNAKPMGIWEHVGDYGHKDGDIPARGGFMIRALDREDPPRDWALIGTTDPQDDTARQERIRDIARNPDARD